MPAGRCITYIDRSGTHVTSVNGGLRLVNPSGPVKAHCVCRLPVPEKAKVHQFVMVGNVSDGEISAYIAGVPWNQPNRVRFYAHLSLLRSTPFEVPLEKQKKVVWDLPISGTESLTIDRSNPYYIEAEFKTSGAVDIQNALELFYFEVYWDYDKSLAKTDHAMSRTLTLIVASLGQLLALLGVFSPLVAVAAAARVYDKFRVSHGGARRSLGSFTLGVLGVGALTGWMGVGAGISISCALFPRSNLCGLPGIFVGGPVFFSLGVLGYLFLWVVWDRTQNRP